MIRRLIGKALSVMLIPFGWVVAWALDVDLDYDDDR